MILVLDTNVLIASLIKNSLNRSLLLSLSLELYLPEYALEETGKYIDLISEKSKLSHSELKVLLSLLLERIRLIPAIKISKHIKEAEYLIGDLDPNDVPFIALALSFPNDGIWSNDKHFIKQKKIKIWTTNDLILYFNLDKEK